MDIKVSSMTRTYEVQRTNKPASAERLSRAEERSDMLILSSKAKNYNTAKKSIVNTPEIRSEKVESLRSQIEAGTYNVTGMDVANKLFAQLT